MYILELRISNWREKYSARIIQEEKKYNNVGLRYQLIDGQAIGARPR
jgi:hypothetical protein